MPDANGSTNLQKPFEGNTGKDTVSKSTKKEEGVFPNCSYENFHLRKDSPDKEENPNRKNTLEFGFFKKEEDFLRRYRKENFFIDNVEEPERSHGHPDWGRLNAGDRAAIRRAKETGRIPRVSKSETNSEVIYRFVDTFIGKDPSKRKPYRKMLINILKEYPHFADFVKCEYLLDVYYNEFRKMALYACGDLPEDAIQRAYETFYLHKTIDSGLAASAPIVALVSPDSVYDMRAYMRFFTGGQNGVPNNSRIEPTKNSTLLESLLTNPSYGGDDSPKLLGAGSKSSVDFLSGNGLSLTINNLKKDDRYLSGVEGPFRFLPHQRMLKDPDSLQRREANERDLEQIDYIIKSWIMNEVVDDVIYEKDEKGKLGNILLKVLLEYPDCAREEFRGMGNYINVCSEIVGLYKKFSDAVKSLKVPDGYTILDKDIMNLFYVIFLNKENKSFGQAKDVAKKAASEEYRSELRKFVFWLLNIEETAKKDKNKLVGEKGYFNITQTRKGRLDSGSRKGLING